MQFLEDASGSCTLPTSVSPLQSSFRETEGTPNPVTHCPSSSQTIEESAPEPLSCLPSYYCVDDSAASSGRSLGPRLQKHLCAFWKQGLCLWPCFEGIFFIFPGQIRRLSNLFCPRVHIQFVFMLCHCTFKSSSNHVTDSVWCCLEFLQLN